MKPEKQNDQLTIFVRGSEHESYRAAAQAAGLSKTAWIRHTLNAAVGNVIIPPPPPMGAVTPPPVKSMFAKPELSEHHEEIMATLQGVPLAEYCRKSRVANPRPWVPEPDGSRSPLPDSFFAPEPEQESKNDRREREWAKGGRAQ